MSPARSPWTGIQITRPSGRVGSLRDVSRQLAYPNERRIVRIALDLLYRDSRG